MDNLVLDCEYNSYKGELISIALVDLKNNRFFYQTLDHTCMNIDPWVQEHVIPYLFVNSISLDKIQKDLEIFLSFYSEINILCDWPEDLKIFSDLLLTGPGTRINTAPITTFSLIRNDYEGSIIPHNALSDAYAIARAHYNFNENKLLENLLNIWKTF